MAAWTYTMPEVNDKVDVVFQHFYDIVACPYWEPARKLWDDKYRSIDFPFEPVDGALHTGPFQFVTERLTDLDHFFAFISSWSAFLTVKENGVELLSNDMIEDFKNVWTDRRWTGPKGSDISYLSENRKCREKVSRMTSIDQ
ncbi:hypothetical protein F2P56_009838 [Juglans regia]|uniref:Uncharacterized protein LOC109020636 n=2 Tax=Juglans regia TaxID=51240 RepID=A0A6P9ECW8_JUGRE|nr:uncharacterized protein LOC109020636 [Juglans regia]KAF5473213.1 hypothetical protein F2P56_009838 [Juglans regia]